VLTPLETDVMIHRGELSMGCIMVNKDSSGNSFYETLIEHRGFMVMQLVPIDMRSESEKAANPIDYEKIGRVG
jgi:hypothetical protein